VTLAEEIEEGVIVLTDKVCEEHETEDPEGVLGAIGVLFDGYHQYKWNPGYTAQWHSQGREEEENAREQAPAGCPTSVFPEHSDGSGPSGMPKL